MKFKEFLNDALAKHGWKPTDLAKKSGVSDSCISNYLHGYVQPSDTNLNKILKVLGETYNPEIEVKDVKDSKNWANRMTVKKTAELLGCSQQTIRSGLIQGSLKFGAAVKNGNTYTYLIWPKKFTEITGIEVQ